MTSIRYNILALAAGGLLMAASAGCSATSGAGSPETGRIQLPLIGSEPQAVPMAVIYQVSGGVHSDRVPVTLTADGKGVLSYPAPTDLTEAQKPVDLGDGWWLDRRGISPASVFTTYTYGEYAALEQAPDIPTLLSRTDRTLRITRMVELPVTAAEAAADPTAARSFIEGGMTGCRELSIP